MRQPQSEGDFVQRLQNLWTPCKRATRTWCRGCPDSVRFDFEGRAAYHKGHSPEKEMTEDMKSKQNQT